MNSLAGKTAIAGVLIVSSSFAATAAENLTGVAKVVGGDTLKIGQTIVRLQNINGIPEAEICGPPDRKWRCGWSAINAIANFVGQHWITCNVGPNGATPTRTISAECFAGPVSINRWMVEQGWAKASTSDGGDYRQNEINARRLRRGIWGDGASVRLR